METLFQLAMVAGLLFVGLVAGTFTERRHLRSLALREEELADVLITSLRGFPRAVPGPTPPTLLVAEVVLASDYLKAFLASLRQLFGGEVAIHRALVIRARREAILRLAEQARFRGYGALTNLHVVMADVGATGRRGVPLVCAVASATAYHAEPPAPRF